MNSDLLLANVFLWSAQVAILALAAAVASLALQQARLQLHFWQAILTPVPIQKREPEYTPEARQAGL
jgi:hypothetical protein